MSYPSTIWNTVRVNQQIERLRFSGEADLSCFHNGDIELKADNILFQMTSEEIDEFHRCSEDIIYFVEKYCRFLTDKGRTVVSLRSYQKKILESLASEMWNDDVQDLVPAVRNLIMLQARQSGKCLFTSKILIQYPNGDIYNVPIVLFYYMQKKKINFLEKIKLKLIKFYLILEK